MREELFDEEMSRLVSQETPYNQQRHEKMLQEVTMMYKEKTKRAKYLMWAYLIVYTGLILFGFQQFFRTDNVKVMILTMALIIIFHSSTVLVKLWCGTESARNAVLEELKALRLQLAEMKPADNS